MNKQTTGKGKSLVTIDNGPEPLIAKYPLPTDILADLVDAFQFYDKQQQGFISMVHFHNILHNFGFADRSKKETEAELTKIHVDHQGKSGIRLDEIKAIIGYRWKLGRLDEARNCFKIFDKRDRGYINAQDIKTTFSSYLDFPVAASDIDELIAFCDNDGTGQLDLMKFGQMYDGKAI